MPLRTLGPPPHAALKLDQLPTGFLVKVVSDAPPEWADGGSLEFSPAQPIYVTPLIAFLKDRVLESARLWGWQYVATRGEEAIATAEIESAAGELAYSGIFEGAHVQGLVDALSFAEQLEIVRMHSYELRILRAPGLLHAVWLWSARSRDFLIPIHLAPPPLQANTLYTERQVSDALRPLAMQRISVSDEEPDV